MDINIQIAPELASQLRHEAESRGIPLDRHIASLLESVRPNASSTAKRLSASETDLLQKINSAIPVETWARYRALAEKKEQRSILPEELQELIQLTDAIELANAERLEHLIQLASIRGISVPTLMSQLGVKPANYDA